MNCPHCHKEITDNTTNLLINPQLNLNNGCQPTWQGTFVINTADVNSQFMGLNNINCAAGCAVPTNTFYIKF